MPSRRPACANALCPSLATGPWPLRPTPTRPQLYKVANSQPSPEQLRAAYDAVCARFPPAMHHFFLENFRDPGGQRLRTAADLCVDFPYALGDCGAA